MRLNDDDHKVAKIIKDLEERVADLEETNRSGGASNPLVTVTDTVGVGDSVTFNSHDVSARGTWGGDGWSTAGWGSYS